ncbi:uncharacterized protein LOC116114646 [Pistacia vera]|uniref:uncharacterized protein LOC116114646 n=1 Tax=Pistacia vera TaxID=55513 RepID=UPI001263B932|nr:uncharacterized protein LOC116114646 [Pistacia vera]
MESNSKNSRNVRGGGGGLPVEMPPDIRKIVQNLREVVGRNCTDSEIYAVLVDCNMDADDAVQRLLSQDTFHEVKSKRERRKEMKETQELRAARCNSGTSSRGARLGNDGVSYIASTENNCNELGKAAYKREIGSSAPLVSSSPSYVYRATGKNINEQPSTLSNFFNADNRRQSIGTGDAISSSVQLSLGLQPAWPGVSKGHLSMADIVRRGRQENRGSEMSTEISCMPQLAASTNSSHSHIKSPQTSSPPESMMHQDLHSPHLSNLSEMIHESGMTANQHDVDNEWPVIENLTSSSGSSALCTSADPDTEVYANQSCMYGDTADLSTNSQPNKVQVSERDIDIQNLNSANGSSSASTRQIFANGAGGASDDDLLQEKITHDSLWHMSKPQEGMASSSDLPFPNRAASVNGNITLTVSSAAANLLQLNIGKEELAMPPPENNSTVVLPNYLQAFSSDCSHLSFGTYKSGAASASPKPVASNPFKSNLEFSAAIDGSSAGHLNIRDRNSGYLADEHLGFLYDIPTTTADVRNYELLVSSPAEVKTQDALEATCGHPYISPLPVPDSSIKNIQQSSPKSSFVITPNARNLPTSLSEMVLNSGTFCLPQQSSQTLPGSNLAYRAVPPQLLSERSYSQPTLPLGESANMFGYPSIPQSQTYVPSALQQAYQGSSTYHDSVAGMNYNLLQYRNGATMSSLPLSNDSTSAYRSFVGNTNNIPGNFLLNMSTSPTRSAVGYNDLLHYQYRDGNNSTRFQQNNHSTWDSGIGSQTMLLQDGSCYSLLGQNPQHAGYQQGQPASHHYESLGYPNMYPSQTDYTRTSAAKPW